MAEVETNELPGMNGTPGTREKKQLESRTAGHDQAGAQAERPTLAGKSWPSMHPLRTEAAAAAAAAPAPAEVSTDGFGVVDGESAVIDSIPSELGEVEDDTTGYDDDGTGSSAEASQISSEDDVPDLDSLSPPPATDMKRVCAVLCTDASRWRCDSLPAEVRNLLQRARPRLVSGSADTTARVWDAQTGKLVRTLRGHKGPVTAVAVHPCGRIVTGSSDKSVRMWDSYSGRSIALLKGHDGPVSAMSVLANRRFAVAAGAAVTIWQEVSLPKQPEAASPSSRKKRCCKTSPLATVQHHLRVKPAHGEPEDAVLCVQPLTEVQLAAGYASGKVRVWNVDTGELCCTVVAHKSAVNRLALHHDAFLSAGQDGTLGVWETQSGKLRRRITVGRPILVLTVLPDHAVAVGSLSSGISVYRVSTGEFVHRFSDDTWVSGLVVLPDGSLFGASRDSPILHEMDAKYKHRRWLQGHSEPVLSLTVDIFHGVHNRQAKLKSCVVQ